MATTMIDRPTPPAGTDASETARRRRISWSSIGGWLRGIVRGRPGSAVWERPALLALLAVTAFLYLWDLSVSGWANSFYSAAVQAGSVDWEAFFYGSSDAANSITVDKPPMSLWFMALSVRLLGLSSFSILLPEALMGVASVGVLYATLRRRFSAGTALFGGAVLALTPIAALMFRFNNPDALLVLLMSLATYFTLRGVEDGRVRWMLWAGVMVGFGFLTKQLQVFLILPALVFTYLWASQHRVGRRLLHLLAGLGAIVVSAGWWVAIVELVPASMRPFIGGSQTNDFLELTFGYNGFGRLTGAETGSVTGGGGGGATTTTGQWGSTGILRLFENEIGGQISWLLPAALVAVVVGFFVLRRAPRTSVRRATLTVFAAWMLVTALFFSFMGGIFHAYYTVALAPAIAGTVAIGASLLWTRRRILTARIVLAALVLITAAWAWVLLSEASTWVPALKVIVVILAVAGAGLLLLPPRSRLLTVATAAIALAAVLLAPTAYTIETVTTAHTGSIVTAGPAVASGGLGGGPGGARGGFRGGVGGPGGAQIGGPTGTAPGAGGVGGPGGPGGPGGAGGLLNAASVGSQLATAIEKGASSYTWAAAAVGSNSAAGYQLATGLAVMPVGGFNGSDPSPTLAAFQKLVANHEIHWFIGGTIHTSNGGSASASAIASWVAANFTATTVDGVTLYDLTAG